MDGDDVCTTHLSKNTHILDAHADERILGTGHVLHNVLLYSMAHMKYQANDGKEKKNKERKQQRMRLVNQHPFTVVTSEWINEEEKKEETISPDFTRATELDCNFLINVDNRKYVNKSIENISNITESARYNSDFA